MLGVRQEGRLNCASENELKLPVCHPGITSCRIEAMDFIQESCPFPRIFSLPFKKLPTFLDMQHRDKGCLHNVITVTRKCTFDDNRSYYITMTKAVYEVRRTVEYSPCRCCTVYSTWHSIIFNSTSMSL